MHSSPPARRPPARRLPVLASGLAVASLVTSALAGCSILGTPRFHGPATAHFDGDEFSNMTPAHDRGFSDLLRWALNREPGPWHPYTDTPFGPPPPFRVGRGELRITFVNHATALIQTDGLNVLTDPIWSERASPVSWAGHRRMRPPGIRFEDLPPVDVVLVSHNHYDHLDLPTLRRLAAAHAPRFFVPVGNKVLLERAGIAGVTDLDWWQSVELVAGVRLTAVPAQHFSGRGLADRDRALWAGFVVTSSAGATFFAGDTGFGPHFRQIAERAGPIRVALLPIGAYRPEWFMAPVHESPREAVKAARILGVEAAFPIHFGTFRLADDGQDEPLTELASALASSPGVPFEVLEFGGGRALSNRGVIRSH